MSYSNEICLSSTEVAADVLTDPNIYLPAPAEKIGTVPTEGSPVNSGRIKGLNRRYLFQFNTVRNFFCNSCSILQTRADPSSRCHRFISVDVPRTRQMVATKISQAGRNMRRSKFFKNRFRSFSVDFSGQFLLKS